MDIVIYMREEDYIHKTYDGTYFWSMGRVPKNFKEGERIYIVAKHSGTDCGVQGFVVCDEFNSDDLNGETLVWKGLSFELLNVSIPCKPFRGFRYKWWDK